MKKHRKLVALLVALTFLFSVAAPAMAATPSDAEKSADKLNVLGIIEGYPDGSFGLDQDITRAEFAKIAVVAAGMKDAANLLVNTPSKFSDVKTGEWYTGWINVAASQGFVKGDPAGTFRPNDKITYAEVVTVLLRILGYNDNLPGDWPTNYLAKAVTLDITEGISLDAKAPAMRGSVFMMVDKTLDTPMVEWENDKQVFTEKEDDGNEVKLIAQSFEGAMKSGLVAGAEWDSKGNLSVEIRGIGKDNLNDLDIFEVSDDIIVTGAPSAAALLGSYVEYITNDDDEVVYAGVKDTDVVIDDEMVVHGMTVSGNWTMDGGELTIDDKEYDLADDFDISFFPEYVAPVVTGDDRTYEADQIKVVLDRNGDAQWAFVNYYSGADIIVDIDDEYIDLDGRSIEIDEDDNFVVLKNGSLVSYDELAEGDLVYYYPNFTGLDYIIIASDIAVEGNFDKANAGWTKLTVDDVSYDASKDGVLVSQDDGDEFSLDDFDKEMFDTDVTMILSPVGKVAVMIADVDAASSLYGVVTDGIKEVGYQKVVRIRTADGLVTYDVDNDFTGSLTENELYKYKLNSDGEIKSAELITADYSVVDDATSRVELNDGSRDKWYSFASDAVFFGKDGDSAGADWLSTTWSVFKKASGIDSANSVAVAFNSDGKVVAMAYNGKVTDAGRYGIVMASGNDRDGFYYELATKGDETVTYYTYHDEAFMDGSDKIGSKTLVTFEVSDNDIIDMSPVDYDVENKKVDEVKSDYIKVDGEFYDISDDTVIVDITGSSPKFVSRISRSNYVSIYGEDDDGYTKFIVIVD